MSKPGSLRMFIAADLPDALRDALGELQESLRMFVHHCRWVTPANIHLTLKFLGDVPFSLVERIEDRLANGLRDMEPYHLHPDRLGFFPDNRHPRVLWVGFKEVPASHRILFQRMENILKKLGFPRERKGLVPHLTLGRFRTAPRERNRGIPLPSLPVPEGLPPFEVSKVVLYKSILQPSGAVYHPIKTFFLFREDSDYGSKSQST